MYPGKLDDIRMYVTPEIHCPKPKCNVRQSDAITYILCTMNTNANRRHGVLSSLSSFISPSICLISRSVRVGGTIRANMAPNYTPQHVTKSNDNIDLPMYTDLRNEAPTQRHSCRGMYYGWSDPYRCRHLPREK